jgi:ParB family chromosome partitioning protein
MIERQIESIPIAAIRVVNPRSRDKIKFLTVVSSIGAVGLKRPIIVARRALDADGTQYDLVCGQGRMEAMVGLGEKSVPAIVVDASREEQLLMSLVENIARRPPSNRDLIREVRALMLRKYSHGEIASKLGLDRSYINGVIRLLENGQESLIGAVEAGRLPISVAVNIAGGNDVEVQHALAEAYEKGELRGGRLKAAKRIIAERIAKRRNAGKANEAQRRMTGDALVREYQRQIRDQKNLIRRASATRDRLLLLVSAFRELIADEHFVTLLRAEQLTDMPEQLAVRLK